jgi:hypothetical protein
LIRDNKWAGKMIDAMGFGDNLAEMQRPVIDREDSPDSWMWLNQSDVDSWMAALPTECPAGIRFASSKCRWSFANYACTRYG